MQEVGNELITLYEKTGVEPFREVDHQGQLTPLQRHVIIETVNQNNKDKQQKVEEARNGGDYNGVPNAAHNGGARSKQKEMLKEQYGEEDKSFTSKEYQDGDPPPLVVDDEDDD